MAVGHTGIFSVCKTAVDRVLAVCFALGAFFVGFGVLVGWFFLTFPVKVHTESLSSLALELEGRVPWNKQRIICVQFYRY